MRAIAEALRSNITLQKFVFAPPSPGDASMEAESRTIATQTMLNNCIAELLDSRKFWRVGEGWRGLGQDLTSLLEQSLIRTDVKLGHRPHSLDGTRQPLLELQLCLSRLWDQCRAVSPGH